LNAGKYGTNADFSNAEASFNGEMTGPKYSYESPVTNENVKANSGLHPMGNKSSKSSKSKIKVSGDQSYTEIDGKGQLTDDSSRFNGLNLPIYQFFSKLLLTLHL
jgi:ubiquitin carboxyl-terminal hydrolase 36/42